MVLNNEKAISSNYDVLKVAFHIDDVGGLLGGSSTFAEVRVCPLEVVTFQLGSLPSSMACEGHLDGALEDIANGEAANNRIFKLDNEFADLTTRIQAFIGVSTCIIRG